MGCWFGDSSRTPVEPKKKHGPILPSCFDMSESGVTF